MVHVWTHETVASLLAGKAVQESATEFHHPANGLECLLRAGRSWSRCQGAGDSGSKPNPLSPPPHSQGKMENKKVQA